MTIAQAQRSAQRAKPVQSTLAPRSGLQLEWEALRTLAEDLDTVRSGRVRPECFGGYGAQLVYEALVQLARTGEPSTTRADLEATIGPERLQHATADVVAAYMYKPRAASVDELLRATDLRAARIRQDHAIMRLDQARELNEPLGDALQELDAARARVQELERPAASVIDWRPTTSIFEPLPPAQWLAAGLQLGPGRPAMLAGYGASAKTLSAQALALAVASGTPAWGHFETSQGEVRHLDYEQGFRATARRYQRLTFGHGLWREQLDDRLKLAVFPNVYLDSPNAVDAYARACDGAALVILDALRGATPTMDENDSAIRTCLDNLTRVSEKTGTAFMVIHHAGKPKEGHGDKRTILRGSSAIFDACGCVFVVVPGKSADEPRCVSQEKSPAEVEGARIDDFGLMVEDVPGPGNPTAGVRVVHRAFEKPDADAARTAQRGHEFERLIAVVKANPGASQKKVAELAGINKQRACDLLDLLAEDRRLRVVSGPRNAKTYFLGDR